MIYHLAEDALEPLTYAIIDFLARFLEKKMESKILLERYLYCLN